MFLGVDVNDMCSWYLPWCCILMKVRWHVYSVFQVVMSNAGSYKQSSVSVLLSFSPFLANSIVEATARVSDLQFE